MNAQQATQHVIDGKVAVAGAGSAGAGIIHYLELVNPVVDSLSGVASLVGACLAIWWTVMRIRDAYAERRNSKGSKDS